MTVDGLVRLEDVGEEPLSWTRPNFFAIRYELTSSAGVVVRLGVQGIGPERHILAETAEAEWRLDLFPLNRPRIPIFRVGNQDPVGFYVRDHPTLVESASGRVFQFRTESALKTVVELPDLSPIFTLEQVEAFPRWRVETRLEPHAADLPELPMVLAAACCFLVFS